MNLIQFRERIKSSFLLSDKEWKSIWMKDKDYSLSEFLISNSDLNKGDGDYLMDYFSHSLFIHKEDDDYSIIYKKNDYQKIMKILS